MAPLSILPGRLRFETETLIGNKEGCLLVEEMLAVEGVNEASASHRTGRVLVKFDETIVTRVEIEELLEKALCATTLKEKRPEPAPKARQTPASTSGVNHFVMEMALHAFLPGPLDLLLPMAASAFRR